MSAPGSCRWILKGVLVAGKRHDGKAWGRNQEEAVRHFAARTARDQHVDIAAAIMTAVRDPWKTAEVDTSEN